MFEHLKFLHCMGCANYLESALNDGLMFTEHDVNFKPTNDSGELAKLINTILPIIQHRLNELSESIKSLGKTREKVIFAGVGNISGKIPMLCFSEVPNGRDISEHSSNFGEYAIVISQSWLHNNGADRVIYVGDNSPVSRHLFRNLAAMRSLSLFKDDKNQVLFNNFVFPPLLDLFSFIEVRDHLQELEWRIVGNHGFMGGKKDTGKRLPLQLDDIEYLFVPNKSEVTRFNKLVSSLGAKQNSTKPPVVMEFPNTIPT